MTETGRRRIVPPIVPVAIFATGILGTVVTLASSVGLAAVLVLGVAIVAAATWAARGIGRPDEERQRVAPNELRSDPVSERLDAFFERIDRLPTDRLDILAVKPLDPARHRSAVDRALVAVDGMNRNEILRRADEAIEQDVPRRLSGRGSYFTGGLVTGEASLPPRDRVRLIATLRDAALAIVAGDAIDAETTDELLGPCEGLLEPRDPAS